MTKTETKLLEALKSNTEALNIECGEWWTNIKIPFHSMVVPTISLFTKRELDAAANLVKQGKLLQMTKRSFTNPYKPE